MSIKNDLITTEFIVQNGPPRNTLFNAIEYAMDKNVSFNITFSLHEKGTREEDARIFKPLRIDGIVHNEDYEMSSRRGQSFIVMGYCDLSELATILPPGDKSNICRFEMTYFTDDRTGEMKIHTLYNPLSGSDLYRR